MRWTKGQSGRKRGAVTRTTDVPAWGTSTIDQMDQRVRAVKVMQHNLSVLYSDLGGLSNISVMEKILCDKIIQLKRLTEKNEELMLQDKPIDEGAYLLAVNCLSGLLSKIGLKRRAKLLPSLTDYLNTRSTKPEPQAPQPAPQGPQPSKEDPSC